MHRATAPTVVFDLDGTLVDTVPDIAVALDRALAPYGATATTPAEAATMMGDGLNEFFWRALVQKRLSLSAQEADAARVRFIAAYREQPARLSQVYPGIRALLLDLRARGAITAVCTNKVEPIARIILDRLGLTPLFDTIVGSGGDRPMKPDPRPLEQAVRQAGGTMSRAILVGDTGADNGAAIAAGVPVVLLTFGYSHVPIRAFKYGAMADNAAELREAVMGFVAGGEAVRLLAPLSKAVAEPGDCALPEDQGAPYRLAA
jgi:phosphoglycolate phosphatase